MLKIFLLAAWPALLCSAATITRLSPTLGRPGDVISIAGSGFAADPAQIDVRFGPNRAPVLSSNGDTLTVQVPNGQPYAPTQVSVDGGNSLTFQTATNTKTTGSNPCLCVCNGGDCP